MSINSKQDTVLPPLPVAPLWRRVASIFYDLLLLLALMMVISGIYYTIVHKWILHQDDPILGFNPALAIILFVVSFFFFAYFWRSRGQTLGMQVWRIRVQDEHGFAISWWQCLVRFLVAIPSIGLCGAGLIWMQIDKDRKTLQDRASISEIILLPKGFYGLKKFHSQPHRKPK